MLAGSQIADHDGFHVLLIRLWARDPAPLAFFITSIQIEAAHTRGRHRRKGQIGLREVVAAVNRLRIGFEAHHHACRITTQAPNGRCDGFLSLGRQTIKPAQTLLIAPSAAFHAPARHILPLRIRRHGRAFRFGRSFGRLRDGERRDEEREEGNGQWFHERAKNEPPKRCQRLNTNEVLKQSRGSCRSRIKTECRRLPCPR